MDLDLLNHLATLSKINVEEQDKETIMEEMSKIIDLMDSIRSVEVSPLPPAPGVDLKDLRVDKAKPSLTAEEALQNATDVRDGCFTVPKIME